ncbi:hypothetical protein JMJ77_0000016 [Colletotrichum scovillei]|uniref:Uncharacterized protein n=1 Tax=Colletotrichum scovillei TaxID=1209932 RepID=A0A9P7R8K5_9PEZI|nr:hypothetical protein JMJ77_0000016 [Colletotrichum scovillei]KAG7071213.1 hypothetical protein JMJ76_0004089 [Colletotrichum scovillei]KAG7079507.1 hypothetical protein JMJ78_0006615 [Colletotrichum scovillei]
MRLPYYLYLPHRRENRNSTAVAHGAGQSLLSNLGTVWVTNTCSHFHAVPGKGDLHHHSHSRSRSYRHYVNTTQRLLTIQIICQRVVGYSEVKTSRFLLSPC